MDIIIQSLGFKAGESLEHFIAEKINGLKSDTIIRANVTLFKGPDTNPENNYCEVRLEVPGNDLFVKKSSQYFETSVSECTEILTSMLNKTKKVSTDRRQAQAMEIQDALIEGDISNDETELEDVVK